MKLSNFGILFAVILGVILVLADIDNLEIAAAYYVQDEINRYIDSAVENALYQAVQLDDGAQVIVDEERAIDLFMEYLNIQTENHTYEGHIRNYIPVIAFVRKEGVDFYCNDGQSFRKESVPYLSVRGNYKIYYTLGDELRLICESYREDYEGHYHDLYLEKGLYFFEEEEFIKDRRACVIKTLSDNFSRFTKEYNLVAGKLGLDYHFAFPTITEDDWSRTIENQGMIVLFQGYPVVHPRMGVINKVGIAGCELRKERT
ncbi:MAG: hypothetical protein K6G65_02520 [Lachnospiraceae bacterium]|nr:hypothetical protein [Lachnospiraceae bacterium]